MLTNEQVEVYAGAAMIQKKRGRYECEILYVHKAEHTSGELCMEGQQ